MYAVGEIILLRDHTLFTSHLPHVDRMWYLASVTILTLHVDHAHEIPLDENLVMATQAGYNSRRQL